MTTILIVDDEARNRKQLEELLRSEGYQTLSATSGDEALAWIAGRPPDLILLDMIMPGKGGLDVARELKSSPTTSAIPIIMVSARLDRESRVAGLAAGAEDFLTKPVEADELFLRVRNLLRLKDYGDFLKNHNAILEQQVQSRLADIHHLANYDVLTGLSNRILFRETLNSAIPAAAARAQMVVVLSIDIDNFKAVNDTFGRAQGDELLRQLSHRLVQCAPARESVTRVSADEFSMTISAQDGQHAAQRAAHQIRQALRAPFDLAGRQHTVTASIGIAVYPGDASSPEVLMRHADTAMNSAKQAGRDTFRFFTQQMNAEVLAKLELEAALREAFKNNEFVLHYQPKIKSSTGEVSGLEALLRWDRPGYGLASPNEFIAALEETGLIVGVGAWVIDAACAQMAIWNKSDIGNVHVSVNVSALQFAKGDVDADVARSLNKHNIAPHLLELELTESAMMANTEHTISILQTLKKRGVIISIDDFGTGYSSLAYLHRFPIDKLKIDIAFVRAITENPDDVALALTIIRMAHSLKLDVIAEGVETAVQLAYLNANGCDHVQGYYFSQPLAAPELGEFMRRKVIEQGQP
jgi:diguanylate cyclase (GGDEF)-like protein